HKNIDAVLVAVPDHTHAFATMAAIKLGKHVYCEKPLTHSIWEARQIREATAKYKVATQMGNSGHSSEGTRLLVEWVRAGAIGNGALGDMGCHIINAPFWALELEFPSSVEAETSGCNLESYPLWSKVKWQFPANGNRGPVTLNWYDGAKFPERPKELDAERNL